jgi:ubiquinone/menaquinone biosynthesis C-methylase UbiE
MRILDLGCGEGLTPQKLSLPRSWQIVGLDVKYAAVSKAHFSFPHRAFLCSASEKLPFLASSFDRVIANVSLPYTDIAKTLAETYRVLAPGGTVLASLHPLTFTLAELRKALLKPKAALGRIWVLANGAVFHVAGRNFGEGFQTERGIRIALQRANFANVSFRHDSKRWFAEATKPAGSLLAASRGPGRANLRVNSCGPSPRLRNLDRRKHPSSRGSQSDPDGQKSVA